ncbi:hypothetical protein TA3x_003246 [Tundrisphaera sp. TA3]|uniref:hypothetical protein n=1 Tax=Tundrisphaera sp. TA3 TaxID=3435775 RepID=UPI003EBD47CB
MKIGINESRTFSYQAHLSSPDVMTQGLLIDVGNLQRRLVEDYVPGSDRLVCDAHNEPYNYPNDYLTGECSIPTTSGPVVVQYRKLSRQSELFIRWNNDPNSQRKKAIFEAATASGLPAGRPIDFRAEKWSNTSTDPADWAMNEYVRPDGRRTGFPEGLRPGQRMKFRMVDFSKRFNPGGDWSIRAKGTGKVRIAINYRDRPGSVATIAIVGGVPSGPLRVEGDECYGLGLELIESDPADPLHDLRVIEPGTWPADLDSRGRGYEGKSFVQIYDEHADDPAFYLPHPARVRDGRHFAHGRYVDVQATIQIPFPGEYHGIVDPSDRSLPTFGFGKEEGGVGGAMPWEWQIEYAALAGQDFYLCTGHEWTDETVVAFCDVFKACAPPWMKLLVEYSCETWNYDFSEYYASVILGSAYFHPGALESITYDPGTGKATANKPAHGYSDGDTVQVYGASEAAYNGTFTISGVTADSFRFTPASAPRHSPARPTNIGRPGVFKLGRARTSEVSSIELVWKDAADGYYAHSGFKVTTPAEVVKAGDVIALCNADGVGVDGFWLVSKPPGYAANEFLLNFQYQALHHPVLAPVAGPVTPFGPIDGRQILACVVGSATPSAEVIHTGVASDRWSGYRAGSTFKVIQSQFPGHLNRLVMIVAGFVNNKFQNDARCEAAKIPFGGKLPPISESTLHIASYHEPEPDIDHRATYVGDVKPLASVVVSGGVATATVKEYPSGPEMTPSTAHGWSSGDQVTIQNVAQAGGNGRYTITPTGASTFTFPATGLPDGPLSGFDGPIFAIKDSAIGVELVGFTRSGHDITYQAPGHPFSVGQMVGIDHIASPRHEGVFAVKATTATTFTVEVDCDFDPSFEFPGRGNAFSAAVLDVYPLAISKRLDGPSYNRHFADLAEASGKHGMTMGIYESGTHVYSQPHVDFVPWVSGALKASQCVPAMRATITKSIALHAARGVRRYTYYTSTLVWGRRAHSFGVKPYQQDTRSQKWPGLLDGIALYGEGRPASAPAARFRMTAPDPHPAGEPGGYGTIGPDGILEGETTIVLDDDGAGGTFTPPTLIFPAGTDSAQPFTYAPPTFGTRPITASISPPLGEAPTAMSVTSDEYGNPGNATVIVADHFDRPDGPPGDGWIVNAADRAAIVGNALSIQLTPASMWTQISTVVLRDDLMLNAQAKMTFTAGQGGLGLLFRSNGLVGNNAIGYGIVPAVGNNSVFVRHFDGTGGDGVIIAAAVSTPYVAGRKYELYARIRQTQPVFDIRVTDVESGKVICEKFGVAAPKDRPPITSPGQAGLFLNSGPATADDVTIWRLGYATGFSLSGPATATVGAASGDFLVTPVGGPLLTDAVVTPSDGDMGGTFDPPSLSFSRDSFEVKAFTYSGSSAGLRSIQIEASPGLATPPPRMIALSASTAEATRVRLSISPGSGPIGSNATVTASLEGGATLASDLRIQLVSSGGAFGGPIAIAAGAASGQTTFTPSAEGEVSISATVTGGGDLSGPDPITFIGLPAPTTGARSPATGYAVILPSTVVIGQAATAIVVLTGGHELENGLLVRLTDADATIGGAVLIPVGNTYGTTSYLPRTSGTHSLRATHDGGNPGMTDPSPTSVFVEEAPSGGAGSGLTLDQIQAACAAAIRATPATAVSVTDKAGYSLAPDERDAVAARVAAQIGGDIASIKASLSALSIPAIAGGVDSVLSASHGSGSWATLDLLAMPVVGRYPAGTAGNLIASIATADAIGSILASTPVAIKAGGITTSSFAAGAAVPLPATAPAGYGGSSLTTAQVQAACASAITATPATVGKVNDKSGYLLAASGLDATSVEAGVNARQALSMILAASAGVISGSGTGSITIKGANSTATRITAITDNAGNRSSIQLNLPI